MALSAVAPAQGTSLSPFWSLPSLSWGLGVLEPQIWGLGACHLPGMGSTGGPGVSPTEVSVVEDAAPQPTEMEGKGSPKRVS